MKKHYTNTDNPIDFPDREDVMLRLRKRAEIRRQIPGRKSVQNCEPDRIADLLDEAADTIEYLRKQIFKYQDN